MTGGGAIDHRALRQTLGQFATGVTVVTCRATDGTPVGMTANSFASVSLEPPLVLWSVERKARSFDAFAAANRFAFSVLAQDQVDISNRFARPGAEKFAETAWHEGEAGVPLIDDAAAHIECAVHKTVDGGDHLTIIGEVMRYERFDRSGLIFAQGRYGTIAPHHGTSASAGVDPAHRHPYDDFLVPLLFRAYNHVFETLSASLAAEDATGAQMRILAILESEGPRDDDAILTRTMLSHTRYEEARQALEEAALIAREAGEYAITEGGRSRLADLLRIAAKRESEATVALKGSEVEEIKALLAKLVRHHEALR
ncbi:MAG: flavin reductase family protein [Pseudomonadota bacterium]